MNRKQITLLLCFTLITLISTFQPAGAEIIPGTTLNIAFESTHIVGSGRNLNMMRVPVTDVDTGVVTFYDVSFKFTYDPVEGLIFEKISSAAISPPLFAPTNIIPGAYKASNGHIFTLENPTVLSVDHSLYIFRSPNVLNAQITSGLGTDNPEYGHREIVPNLKTTYVYGVIAEGDRYGYMGVGWDAGGLIGLRQSGDNLIVSLFSEGMDNDGTITDFREPRETVILTRVQE